MVFKQKSLQDVWEYITNDRDETRFVARVFFVNSLGTYYSFVNQLAEKAEITVRISDDKFCKGSDTVPDLKALIAFLDENQDKDVLVPNLAEYLRIGEATEKNSACLYSILNRHVHSKKRVWIPIFLAKGLFQSIVGHLDEERFSQFLIEIEEAPVDFLATAYSKAFAKQKRIVNAVGIREWLMLWDDQKIKTGMSFATRQIRQMTPSKGDYSLKIISDPYEFITDALVETDAKLSKQLGTDEQWAAIIPFVTQNSSLEDIIPSVLNMQQFKPESIIGNWNNHSETEKWAFNLWYRLGLNKSSDYISFAVAKTPIYGDMIRSLECAILDCIDNPLFDEWVVQRDGVLKKAGYHSPSQVFLTRFDEISDTRVKLKILTGRTHEERTKIIEIISQALRDGKSLNDFKALLQEKYPDLLLYFKPSSYLTGETKEYISQYKFNKIADIFSLQLSSLSGQMDCLQFKSRGALLYALKNELKAPYFLWFDGLGIEWIDMLMAKIQAIDPSVSLIDDGNGYIGTAVLPTITKINMAKADPDTISEKKIDDLDTLSHIKDKNDCNYFSIIAKQFELIGKIAQRIVDSIAGHPDMDVIVTADHGMSRMAAKGFHSTQGVNPPAKSEVYNHGRYCELPTDSSTAQISNTKKDGRIIAFCTHNHFTFSGYAPGEVHGGASPEELLVPVLHFAKKNQHSEVPKVVQYRIASSEVFLGSDGVASVLIQTDEPANSLTVEYNGKMISGTSSDRKQWSVRISGLIAGKSYAIHVYPNNLFSQKTETIFVKTRGFVIDDDL